MPDPFHPDPRELECDLVMKGGVTSGLVYPAAIATIASAYRLRSIGGTSAGAIAAAGAAAMEFGRQSRRNADALADLGRLPADLGRPTFMGSTFLQALFSPDKETLPLFPFASQQPGIWAWGQRLPLAGEMLALLIGGPALAGTSIGMAVVHGWPGFTLPAGLLAGLVTFLVLFGLALPSAIGITLQRAAWRFTQNGMGLINGLTPGGDECERIPVPGLTTWLHDRLQALAGLGAEKPGDVLTFGHLWLGHDYRPGKLVAVKSDTARAIDLVLVATDLNRLQSVNFPFLPERSRLYVDKRQWKRLFPDNVMTAIRETSVGPAGTKQEKPDFYKKVLRYPASDVETAANATDDPDLYKNLMLLPDAPDLPVIVAVRASLAFPGLFTPLPLWLLHWRMAGKDRVPCFSPILLADGGITSNFPIHLFDAPIPTRPTFAINLLYPDDTIIADPFDQNDGEKVEAMAGGGTGAPSLRGDIFMPRSNSGRVLLYKAPPGGTPLAQIGGLAMRVVEAARNWGDISLYSQPGVRDRIVHVRLTDAEGGFNLGMDQATIAALSKKGGLAGEVLTRRFDPDKPSDPLHPDAPVQLNWHNHRFVRLRAFAAAQELLGNRATAAWARATNTAIPQSEPGLDQILTHAGYKKWPSIGNFHIGYTYKLTRDRRNHIRAIIDQLDALKPSAPPEDSSSNSAAVGAPNPRSRLQLRPAGNDPPATKT